MDNYILPCVAECTFVVALLLHAGLMRVLAGILLIVGIPTIVRLSIVVMKREDPPRGMAVAG